ncbi:DUF975 family protein [Holzapfeliella sp. JNUCC 72]
MDRIQIKEKAKAIVSENRGYYFTITFVPIIISVIYSMIQTSGTIGYVTSLVHVIETIDPENLNPADFSAVSSLAGTFSLVGIIVGLVVSVIKFGVRIVMLKSYRKEEPAGESGINDSLYAFKDSRWLAALGFFVIMGIYGAILGFAVTLVGILLGLLLFFIGVAANNAFVTTILVIVGILLLIALILAAIVAENFTSQINYAFLDASAKGDSFSGAISRSFKLMINKENMIQFVSLQASFIGWTILNEITFGILGIVWWNAYAEMTYAGFYDEINKKED